MDAPRKNAYRYLLYWAMVDIRPLAWFRFLWWNPLSWRRDLRRIRCAGHLAYWLHNLALFASLDFERFDEERFWSDLGFLEKHCGHALADRYRTIFEDGLK